MILKLIVIIGLIFITVIVIEIILAVVGKREKYITPQTGSLYFGKSGKKLMYVVAGDSIGAGQGALYKDGIAINTATYLGKKYQVQMENISVSGVTTKDVVNLQLEKIVKINPDIILLSIGANDVTHLVSLPQVKMNLQTIVTTLIKANCNIKIVLTASPDMGTPPRFLQPLRLIVGLRSQYINQGIYKIIQESNIALAPIALKTGDTFRTNPQLFAPDKFHPNKQGYALYSEVINDSLSDALLHQPNHC